MSRYRCSPFPSHSSLSHQSEWGREGGREEEGGGASLSPRIFDVVNEWSSSIVYAQIELIDESQSVISLIFNHSQSIWLNLAESSTGSRVSLLKKETTLSNGRTRINSLNRVFTNSVIIPNNLIKLTTIDFSSMFLHFPISNSLMIARPCRH